VGHFDKYSGVVEELVSTFAICHVFYRFTVALLFGKQVNVLYNCEKHKNKKSTGGLSRLNKFM